MPCDQVIKAKFAEYQRSTTHDPQQESLLSAPSLSNSTATHDHEVIDAQVKRRWQTIPENEENIAQHKRGRRRFRAGNSKTSSDGVNQGEKIDEVAINIIGKIRKALKQLPDKYETLAPSNTVNIQMKLNLLDDMSEDVLPKIRTYAAWEQALWDQSNATQVAAKQSTWYLRLLASYCFLLRTYMTGRDVSGISPASISNDKTQMQVYWRTAASMINAIVLGLSSAWGSKAYFVVQALASR